MLDSDLAKLYECANGTKTVNQAVKRHKAKFPEDFCFQLTEQEYHDFLWSQFGTAKSMNRTLPFVFTELGARMLSVVLKTNVADEMSIKIMRAFVSMRTYISTNLIEQKYINNMVLDDHNKIQKIETTLQNLESEKELNEIYFDGKIYDAYSKIIDIFSEAKEELIIIDRYTDKTILDMIKKLRCRVILIIGKNSSLTNMDIEKYNSTYDNLDVFYTDEYHDRYFIIDKDKIYHSGNSVNHIGYRKSSINVINDKSIKKVIFGEINNIINNS